MFPNIETNSILLKNTMAMSTTNVTKNIPTISCYNKIKPIPKKYSISNRNLESYKSKNSIDLNKKSKILNNSTYNNSINSSNFYEKLYYYPPHKKKYSYANSISTDKCFLYSDFNVNKAPSLGQNRTDIRNMIKKRKKNKTRYLNNLFFNSIIGNKDSQTNQDDNNESSKKEIEFLSYNLYSRNKPARNNSCIEFKKAVFKDKDELFSNKNMFTKSHKNSNLNLYRITNSGCMSTTTYKTINTNKLTDKSKDIIKYNLNSSSKVLSESKINNIFSNTIKDFSYLPNISYQKKFVSNETPSLSRSIIKNKSSFLTNLNTEKMDFMINDCIFESKLGIKKLNEFELKIYKI